MELIPAIDLLDGVAVRLVQGDYRRRAATLADPAPIVAAWVRAGVRRLHLVDLEGARSGRPVHLDQAAAIASRARDLAPDVHVELGGGLRTAVDVNAAVERGIDTAVLGTAAVEDPDLVSASAARWPGRVAVSVDVRGDRVALDGWTRTTRTDAVALAARLVALGAARLIVTDVARDGTRGGPNGELLTRMRAALPDTPLVAAGGIATVDDLRRLRDIGVDGAIVGLALIDGSLDVDAALAAVAAPAGAR